MERLILSPQTEIFLLKYGISSKVDQNIQTEFPGMGNVRFIC